MHPVLRLRHLSLLEKDLVAALATAEGMNQVQLIKKIPGAPSQATISRALSKLAQDGVVEKVGATRGSVFRLSAQARNFAKPPRLRPPAPYDPHRIGGYLPNETRWLPAEAEEKMRAAAASIDQRLDASTYSRQIAERFLIDLSWASSALEGNTYAYLETEALIKFGSEASGHDVTEATMILNHKNAITQLLEQIEKPSLTPEDVSRLHALLMRGLLSPEALGRVRNSPVRVGGTAYEPSSNGDQLRADLGRLCWLADTIESPFEASFLLLAGASYLQAYEDGNKRIGRLTCNLPLLRKGLPPMSFIGLDKADYLTGLILFYEAGDTALLAEIIADGYVQAAPSYTAALAVHRKPRSIELREHAAIEQAVQEIARSVADDNRAPEEAIPAVSGRLFARLGEEDRKLLTQSVEEILAALNETNAVAWGVDAGLARRFAARKGDWEGSSPEP